MTAKLLEEFLSLPSEPEWLEFKEAKNDYSFEKIGQYFSALSNEANLQKQECGWLVFGVTDKRPRDVIGTHYRKQPPGLEKLKADIAKRTNHEITFTEIREITRGDARVLMFQIPSAPRGIPTTWNDTAYGRIADQLRPLTVQKLEAIRSQTAEADWSAQICSQAELSDLDADAIAFSRKRFATKHPHLADEVSGWDDETFLNKARVTSSGQITRTALILLGKPESVHFLSPVSPKLSWLLRDDNGDTKDYSHFEPPFLTAIDQLFARVRNLTYRYLPAETLFPTEVTQYDEWVIREALQNCIAHQNYALAGPVTVIESADDLQFSNRGDFIPATVDNVLRHNAPTETYRNPFLVNAMVQLGMIDQIGSGIRRMFTTQQARFFPLPDFDLTTPGTVRVTIHGRVLDEKYTRMLIARTDLSLFDVVALDKVQKSQPLSESEFKSLKRQRLIEGRRPNLHVSAEVASVTESAADYLKKRGMDKQWCWDRIVEMLELQGTATKKDFRKLLLDKISDARTAQQKEYFITNLLQEMRRGGVIEPFGSGSASAWRLCKPGAIDEG